MDIGQMYFDKGNLGAEKSVPQSNAGVSEGSGIDQYKGHLLPPGLVDMFHQHMFGIALKKTQLMVMLLSKFGQSQLYIGQGIGAINFRFPGAK